MKNALPTKPNNVIDQAIPYQNFSCNQFESNRETGKVLRVFKL